MTDAELTAVNERLADENARLREQLAALQSAYAALVAENRAQFTDLTSWNLLSGAIFRERAEGIETQS